MAVAYTQPTHVDDLHDVRLGAGIGVAVVLGLGLGLGSVLQVPIWGSWSGVGSLSYEIYCVCGCPQYKPFSSDDGTRLQCSEAALIP